MACHQLLGNHSEQAIEQTKSNLKRLGVIDHVVLESMELALWEPNHEKGLLLCDPPYGERIGQTSEIKKIYRILGQLRQQRFLNWEFSVILAEESPWEEFQLRYDKRHPFRNGSIPCQLYRMLPSLINRTAKSIRLTQFQLMILRLLRD